MANNFKNKGASVGTSPTTVYTAPSATTTLVHALYISNIHATNSATVDIYITNGSGDFYIAKNLNVLSGTTAILDKPLNLETTNILKAVASAASTIQIFASLLEMT